jgi:hypothetical protein
MGRKKPLPTMDSEFWSQVQAYLVLWSIHILTIFKRICRKFLLFLAGTRLKQHAFHSRDFFFWGGGGWLGLGVRTPSNFVLLIALPISAVETENAAL